MARRRMAHAKKRNSGVNHPDIYDQMREAIAENGWLIETTRGGDCPRHKVPLELFAKSQPNRITGRVTKTYTCERCLSEAMAHQLTLRGDVPEVSERQKQKMRASADGLRECRLNWR